jgi:hypothetical protein
MGYNLDVANCDFKLGIIEQGMTLDVPFWNIKIKATICDLEMKGE